MVRVDPARRRRWGAMVAVSRGSLEDGHSEDTTL